MALDFPPNPLDGQIYPDPPIPGVQQYIWNSDKGTWLTLFKGLQGVGAVDPIFLSGPEQNPTINIKPATVTSAGSLSAADKLKLDEIPSVVGSVSEVTAGVGIGAPNAKQSITSKGTINLLPANLATIGGVKPGAGVTVSEDGSLSLIPPSPLTLGGVKQGTGINISSDGTISVAEGSGFVVLDTLTPRFDGSRTGFTLTVNSVPYAPKSANSLLIFVGGVIQVPLTSFTVSSSTITFTGAPPTGASFYGISFS